MKTAVFLAIYLILAGCAVLQNGVQNTDIAPGTHTPSYSPSTLPSSTHALQPSHTSTQTVTATQTMTTTSSPTRTPIPGFRFIVNGDMAYHAGPGEFDTLQYFRGMCEQIAALDPVDFMVSVGDTTPPSNARWTIDQYLGPDFLWYPVVGNHELGMQDMDWLRNYDYDPNGEIPPNITNPGPQGCEETTFSFDYLNAHFVVLNVYCDLDNDTRTDGAIVDHLYEWLKNDLENTKQQHVFVFGHEPAFPQPDAANGIIRHLGDSLDQYPITRDRFWVLLQEYQVVAYLTGHTHSYSVVDINGVWQVDIAHSMGARTQATRSTFIIIQVEGEKVVYTTYRVNNFTDEYELTDTGSLK